jgi:hypothetical protein
MVTFIEARLQCYDPGQCVAACLSYEQTTCTLTIVIPLAPILLSILNTIFSHVAMSRPPSTQTETKSEAAPGLSYPYRIRRTYFCGHPDEYIEVDMVSSTQSPVIQHTHVPPSLSNHGFKPYRQTLERCPTCAKQHQALNRQERPKEPVPSLATCQGHLQDGNSGVKDGFLQTLAWYRFHRTSREPIVWPDEGPQSSVHSFLKDAYEQTIARQNRKLHAAVPYRARRDKHVLGPTMGDEKILSYTIMVNVDEALISPVHPPTPPPEIQRHSDSILIEANSRGWPNESFGVSAQDQHGSRRDSGGTSLSFGAQPRNTAKLLSQTESNRGRGGQPLPVFRSRRDMLRERLVASPPKNASPHGSYSSHSPQSPRSQRISEGAPANTVGMTIAMRQPSYSSSSGVSWSSYGSPGLYGSPIEDLNLSTHDELSQQSCTNQHQFESLARSPYHYSPRGTIEDALDSSHDISRRRASEGSSGRSYGEVNDGSRSVSSRNIVGTVRHSSVAGSGRSPYGYSLRIEDERAVDGSYGSTRSLGSRGTKTRMEPNQHLQPDTRNPDSDSDASSIGKW